MNLHFNTDSTPNNNLLDRIKSPPRSNLMERIQNMEVKNSKGSKVVKTAKSKGVRYPRNDREKA